MNILKMAESLHLSAGTLHFLYLLCVALFLLAPVVFFVVRFLNRRLAPGWLCVSLMLFSGWPLVAAGLCFRLAWLEKTGSCPKIPPEILGIIYAWLFMPMYLLILLFPYAVACAGRTLVKRRGLSWKELFRAKIEM